MGGSNAIGTLAWARRTGGRVSSTDRWRLTADAVMSQLSRMPRSLLRRIGLPGRDQPVDLAVPLAPDSQLARTVGEIVESVSSPALLHHLYRVRAWGHLLAQREGQTLDTELFFLAALLHDWGLAGGKQVPGSCCFAYDGAEGALELLNKKGMDPARAELVADAICQHLNIKVSIDQGPEAHFLHSAAALDLLGLRQRAIPRALLEKILAEHPREGWNEEILPILSREIQERPGSRIDFLVRRLDFDHRAESARFPRPMKG